MRIYESAKTEIHVLSRLSHRNIVNLLGYCSQRNKFMLIHKYECNGNLASFLFDEGEKLLELDWKRRYCICFGIAKGLVCIHEQSGMHIAHRHIKPDNILLDENFNPKIKPTFLPAKWRLISIRS